MFERLQKPFLTVETGEAYQPIRLCYDIHDENKLMAALNVPKCLEKDAGVNRWNWHWKEECDDLHFESLDSFRKNATHPPRLGTFTIKDKKLYLNLPSFKRACLAAPFFHRLLPAEATGVHHADFINKVFGLDERLPHGFSELFKEDELEKIVHQRVADYHKIQERCEQAETAEEAFALLSEYTQEEAKKRLPFAERYEFQEHTDDANQDPDVLFLGFYIFLRGRELVAIRRWFGETGYSIADAAEETMEHVFGGMHIDIIE